MEQRVTSASGVITVEPALELPQLAFGRAAVWARAARLGGVALLITLAQIGLVCLLTGQKSLPLAYEQLLQWDGVWYKSVVELGYLPPAFQPGVMCNTSFFPGYPLLAKGLGKLCGFETPLALALTAQLAAWGFWVYVLLFFRRWAVPPALAAVGVLLIAAHAASFFLIVTYSESSFLLGLLGLLYWAAAPRWPASVLAGLHGLLMSGSRLVGAPLVIAPLLHALADAEEPRAAGGRPRRFGRAALACALAGLGMGLFFLYCHLTFGHWDTYLKSSSTGWGTRMDYFGFFSGKIFALRRPNWGEIGLDPHVVNRLSVHVTAAVFVGLLLGELWLARRGEGGWRVRLGFYFCAVVIFYVSVAGNTIRLQYSTARYAQGVVVLLVLALVHQLRGAWPLAGWRDRLLTAAVTAWAVLGFAVQALLAYRYTHGLWVA